jgi:hypothetical protein
MGMSSLSGASGSLCAEVRRQTMLWLVPVCPSGSPDLVTEPSRAAEVDEVVDAKPAHDPSDKTHEHFFAAALG